MGSTNSSLYQARLHYAKRIISEHGDKIPSAIQQDILVQKVSIGMPPYEAYLAAGKCFFKVTADPANWPKNADHFKVIQAQTLHPDERQIWMTFENATQYPEKGNSRFVVFVQGGKVRTIDPVEAAS